jgi:protein-S-isoprenylcysteine O-methyltransferase Ste14
MTRLTFAARWIVMALVFAAIVFGCAGRIDLPGVWAVAGLLATFGAVLSAVGDVGMLRERQRPGQGSQDRITQPVSLVVMLSQWIIAGLDARFGWSPIPLPLVIAGAAGYALALVAVLWAILTNRFYSSVVRVQTDREQKPVTAGPYAFVRHPGYAGSICCALFGGLAVGSWLALIPTAIFIGLFIRRTLLEDRLLIAELPGYADYARQVRYRLLPGIF